MRLLLAEDERELAEALVAVLNHNNYFVDAVYDGRTALDYLQAGNYDAVILDVMMPEMDGFTVLSRVRAMGNDVPVLILTAKADVDDRVMGLDCGADDYLTKPFVMKELLARIRAVTRRRLEATTAVWQLGNIKLDSATFTLLVENQEVRLPNKEYQILELLMANPGQIISIERFMEKIWGYDTEAEIRVLWVYISYLRKRLQKMSANVAIKAIRNQGYFLEELVD